MALTDLPGIRIPWDVDGSLASIYNTSNVFQRELTQGEKEALNNEDDSTVFAIGSSYVGIAFSRPWDVSAYFLRKTDNLDYIAARSLDTTNGSDGSWTALNPSASSLAWKEDMHVLGTPIVGVQGVKLGNSSGFTFRGNMKNMHVYGQPTSDNGLSLWDAVADEALSVSKTNLGEISPGGALELPFRVKNNNAESTATAVVLSSDTNTPGVTWPDVTLFSTDGVGWTSTVDIGNLSPSGVSGEILVRVSPSASSAFGLGLVRVLAQATSWT